MALTQISPLNATWRDCKGVIARNKWLFFINPNGANAGTFVVNFLTAWENLTHAALASYSGFSGLAAQSVAYGTAQDYRDAADKAVFVFQTSKGGLHKFQLPSPATSIFLPDGRTINPLDAGVIGVVNQMTTVISTDFQPSDRDGNPFTLFLGGYRRRAKEPRKVNIFTRDANLTSDEPAGP